MKKRLSALFLALILLLTLCGCGEVAGTAAAEQPQTVEPAQSESAQAPAADEPEITQEAEPEAQEENVLLEAAAGDDEASAPADEASASISEDGSYTSKDDVALYIHTYGHLPDNFITKKQAQALGWSGARWSLTHRANALAGVTLETTKAFCRKKTAGATPNAISTRWARTNAAPNGSSFQTTA